MTRARPFVAATAVVGALSLAITLGYVGGRVSRSHRTVPVSADTFAATWSPQSAEGKAAYLAAGGSAGGAAISYLKFDIDLPAGRPPALAELWLARHSGPLPDLVELTHVPSTVWDEARLTTASAPRLGAVVGSIAPRGYESALRFDVTKVIRTSGTYAFAVTAPTNATIARFIARDDLLAAKAPTITISFDQAGSPSTTVPGAAPSPLIATGAPTPTTPPWPLATPGQVAAQLPGLPMPTFTIGPNAAVTPWPPSPPNLPPNLPPAAAAPPTGPIVPPAVPVMPTGPIVPPVPPSLPPSLPSNWPSIWPAPNAPAPTGSQSPAPADVVLSPAPADPSPLPVEPSPSQSAGDPSPSLPGMPTESPGQPSPAASSSQSASTLPSASPLPAEPACEVGDTLVPGCGVLWGVAPAGHTDVDRRVAINEFEEVTGRRQALYHAYHRGNQLFPTAEEIAIARNEGNPRILFLNWKPAGISWAEISRGRVDSYLDRLAEHITTTFPERFFFTMHHEPEDNVVPHPGSGMTANDFANAFRHVVLHLRKRGVSNMVTAVCYMAYVPWNTQPWFEALYPGDDVVDWVSWDSYAYSDPGYGHGDFAEMMNRRSSSRPDWPGFYNWAATRFPDKPLMVAEWGVWYSASNPGHQATFYDSVARQMELFPRVKAMMYFDTPSQQQGRDSRVDATEEGLRAYRRLSGSPVFSIMPVATRLGPNN